MDGNPVFFTTNMTTKGVKCISWKFFNANSITAIIITTTFHNIYKNSYSDQLMQATDHIQ